MTLTVKQAWRAVMRINTVVTMVYRTTWLCRKIAAFAEWPSIWLD